MCGRFFLKIAIGEAGAVFAAEPERDFAFDARYNLAPTQIIPIVRQPSDDTRDRRLGGARWGLVPSWSTDSSLGAKTINARCETVADKPAYRAAFAGDGVQRGRCLVPASGFYEWQPRPAGAKQPVVIRRADTAPFAMAGVFDSWQSPSGTVRTVSVLTCAAGESVRAVHDRMPVILPPERWALWLRPSGEARSLLSMLVPFIASPLEWYPVSTRVNSVRNDDASLIERVEPFPGSLFG